MHRAILGSVDAVVAESTESQLLDVRSANVQVGLSVFLEID